MGPLDVDRPWQPDDIVGVFRFLQRLWRSLVDEKTGDVRISDTDLAPEEPLYQTLHKTIDAVNSQYRELRFNVAIARLTGLNNTVSQHVQANGKCPREVAESLVLMVAPLAPHIAAELWEKLGHAASIDDAPFPVAKSDALIESEIVIPVTVDGRPRGEITVDKDASEAEVTKVGMGLESVERLLEDRKVVRVIYVPGKVVNLVTRKL